MSDYSSADIEAFSQDDDERVRRLAVMIKALRKQVSNHERVKGLHHDQMRHAQAGGFVHGVRSVERLLGLTALSVDRATQTVRKPPETYQVKS